MDPNKHVDQGVHLLNRVLDYAPMVREDGEALVGLTDGAVPFWVGAGGITLFMIVYVSISGMRGVAWTDTLQGAFMLGMIWAAVLWVLAEVGGARIVDRVLEALRKVTPVLVVSANEPGLYQDLGLPIEPDRRADAGPLAGLHAVLERARSEGRPGILAVAVDMPVVAWDCMCTGIDRVFFSRDTSS